MKRSSVLILLFAMLATLGKAESQKFQVHYTVNIDGKCDSTALYQRIETKNADEPYTIGDIVCYLHNGSRMVAEREYGLYEKGGETYATVTIDGKKYFISALTISGNDASGVDWVYESLPEEQKDKGSSRGRILWYIGGGLLFLLILGRISGPSSSSGTGSGKTSFEIQEERRKTLENQGRKSSGSNDDWHAKNRERLQKEGKW